MKTDKWSSYKPISKIFEIEQFKSEGGVNFKELNTLTMLIIRMVKRDSPSCIKRVFVKLSE